MPTFLNICQTLHSDFRIGGTLSTVSGQTGMLKRVVDAVVWADREIQRSKTNWKFLWSEWSIVLVPAISEYSPPDLLGSFDETSFWYEQGSDDSYQIPFVNYRTFRDSYKAIYSTDQGGTPEVITIRPDGKISILPKPSTEEDGKEISSEYWKKPADLSNDDDVSAIPEQFHDAILYLAKMHLAETMHDTGWYNSASVMYNQIYQELKAHSLPGKQDDRKSESSVELVIKPC
jgi:hypothetical protein